MPGRWSQGIATTEIGHTARIKLTASSSGAKRTAGTGAWSSSSTPRRSRSASCLCILDQLLTRSSVLHNQRCTMSFRSGSESQGPPIRDLPTAPRQYTRPGELRKRLLKYILPSPSQCPSPYPPSTQSPLHRSSLLPSIDPVCSRFLQTHYHSLSRAV